MPIMMRLLALAVVVVASSALPGSLVRAQAQPGDILRDCPTCPEMVVIAPGRFEMGSPADEPEREGLTESNAEDERPVHTVVLAKAFSIGRYEVTRGQFAAFAAATNAPLGDKCWVLGGQGPIFAETAGHSWRAPLFEQTDAHPVVCVNWNEANAYAAWLSHLTGQRYRLPTDAEWEYAARAGAATARPWGDGRDEACAFANVRDAAFSEATGLTDDLFPCRDGVAHTAPVGSFKPNAFGLYDVIGNVAEWTADCHMADYRKAAADGAAPAEKPGCLRTFRVGGFSNTPSAQRSANRVRSPADSRRSNLGFRVVREVTP
jgi:formylglycine-generating enzyme required for sulfatase activity